MTVLLITFIKYSETNTQPVQNYPAFSTALVFNVVLKPIHVYSVHL